MIQHSTYIWENVSLALGLLRERGRRGVKPETCFIARSSSFLFPSMILLQTGGKRGEGGREFSNNDYPCYWMQAASLLLSLRKICTYGAVRKSPIAGIPPWCQDLALIFLGDFPPFVSGKVITFLLLFSSAPPKEMWVCLSMQIPNFLLPFVFSSRRRQRFRCTNVVWCC